MNLIIPGLDAKECPKELVVFVHGAWVGKYIGKTAFEDDSEILNRTKMALEKNNYVYPLVGFTWDSDTTILQPQKNPWIALKVIAKENGHKLAQFILDYEKNCPSENSNIRLIAHSLGAGVVLSALDALYNNPEWREKPFKIASVHLIGAAVDDEEISNNPLYIVEKPALNATVLEQTPLNTSILNKLKESYDLYGIKSSYGNAIEKVVGKFYNLFDSNDQSLKRLYHTFELDNPLGLTGHQDGITLPANYTEKDVVDMIPPFCDANGDNKIDALFLNNENITKGANHAGYYGFRDPASATKLLDDVAINSIVRDWNNTLVPEKDITSIPKEKICKVVRVN